MLSVNVYQTLEKKDSETFIQKIYNPDLVCLNELITFRDEDLKIRNGKYTEWFDDGNLYREGFYENDQKNDVWKFYHIHKGYLEEEGKYLQDKKEGLWKKYDEEQNVILEKNYEADKLNGDFIYYNDEGDVIYTAQYENDDLVSEEIIDAEQYDKYRERTARELPYFSEACKLISDDDESRDCDNTELLNYLYSKIVYPRKDRKSRVQGRAIFTFTIDKKGKVKDIVTKRGVSKGIERLVRVHLFEMPNWEAGVVNGEAVCVHYILPVRFKLE